TASWEAPARSWVSFPSGRPGGGFRDWGGRRGPAAQGVVVTPAALVAAEPAGPAPLPGRERPAAPGPPTESPTCGNDAGFGHHGHRCGHGMTSVSFISLQFVSLRASFRFVSPHGGCVHGPGDTGMSG